MNCVSVSFGDYILVCESETVNTNVPKMGNGINLTKRGKDFMIVPKGLL